MSSRARFLSFLHYVLFFCVGLFNEPLLFPLPTNVAVARKAAEAHLTTFMFWWWLLWLFCFCIFIKSKDTFAWHTILVAHSGLGRWVQYLRVLNDMPCLVVAVSLLTTYSYFSLCMKNEAKLFFVWRDNMSRCCLVLLQEFMKKRNNLANVEKQRTTKKSVAYPFLQQGTHFHSRLHEKICP